MRIAGQALFRVADTNLVQQVENARPRCAALQALMQRQALADLPLDRVQRVERGHRFLKDETDVVATHVAQRRLVGADHLAAHVADRAADPGAVRQQGDR